MSKNGLLSLVKQFFFFILYIKVFIRTECVDNDIIAMEVVNIFLKKYNWWSFVQILIKLLKNSIILLKTK